MKPCKTAMVDALAVMPYAIVSRHEFWAPHCKAPTTGDAVVCETGKTLRPDTDFITNGDGRNISSHSYHRAHDFVARAAGKGRHALYLSVSESGEACSHVPNCPALRGCRSRRHRSEIPQYPRQSSRTAEVEILAIASGHRSLVCQRPTSLQWWWELL